MLARLVLVLALSTAPAVGAAAQTAGSLNPAPLPPLANPDDPGLAAKELFGRALDPAPLPPAAIGGFARGCLAGAAPLPTDGSTWQVMRLSRNRNWGHPVLVAFLERLSKTAPAVGWPGLLVGDMSQPRGGPMLTGHGSHQIGLDADVWLTPMPQQTLSREERETLSATNVVAADRKDINPTVWTPQHAAFIRLAAIQPEVSRVFVNPAIKKALCREAGEARAWLAKVRPWSGHNYHIHIRLKCPAGAAGCIDQAKVPDGDGCGEDLAAWFRPPAHKPKPTPPVPPLTLKDLPAACRDVLSRK